MLEFRVPQFGDAACFSVLQVCDRRSIFRTVRGLGAVIFGMPVNLEHSVRVIRSSHDSCHRYFKFIIRSFNE